MGRSAEEDDRDVLALPVQRPRRRVGSPSTVHPPSFDPEAARKAWRQVARVRGGGPGLGVDGRRSRSSVTTLAGVVLAIGVVWAVWSLTSTEEARVPVAQPVEVAATTAAPTPTDTRSEANADPPTTMPPASIGRFSPKTSARLAPPATEDATQHAPPRAPVKSSASWTSSIPMAKSDESAKAEPTAPEPHAVAPDRLPPLRNQPKVSPESPSVGVAALRDLPKSDRDRPPLEGVGASGIHVDRLDLGSQYDRGLCQGNNRSYSASNTKTVHVCFRAVHRRQTERVLVKWSKNGRLLRRAWVVIPASHAYRTRAGLRLRDSYVGTWTVTVESTDGVVLASGDFKVKP